MTSALHSCSADSALGQMPEVPPDPASGAGSGLVPDFSILKECPSCHA